MREIIFCLWYNRCDEKKNPAILSNWMIVDNAETCEPMNWCCYRRRQSTMNTFFCSRFFDLHFKINYTKGAERCQLHVFNQSCRIFFFRFQRYKDFFFRVFVVYTAWWAIMLHLNPLRIRNSSFRLQSHYYSHFGMYSFILFMEKMICKNVNFNAIHRIKSDKKKPNQFFSYSLFSCSIYLAVICGFCMSAMVMCVWIQWIVIVCFNSCLKSFMKMRWQNVQWHTRAESNWFSHPKFVNVYVKSGKKSMQTNSKTLNDLSRRMQLNPWLLSMSWRTISLW